jgi:hypothetical protein
VECGILFPIHPAAGCELVEHFDVVCHDQTEWVIVANTKIWGTVYLAAGLLKRTSGPVFCSTHYLCDRHMLVFNHKMISKKKR